jgi:hypothetical protein
MHGMMMLSLNAKQDLEAREWAQRTIASDSTDASAYYVIGVADWMLAFPDYQKARKAAGMQPQDPGIIPMQGCASSFGRSI